VSAGNCGPTTWSALRGPGIGCRPTLDPGRIPGGARADPSCKRVPGGTPYRPSLCRADVEALEALHTDALGDGVRNGTADGHAWGDAPRRTSIRVTQTGCEARWRFGKGARGR
jgi:hypothetical protein